MRDEISDEQIKLRGDVEVVRRYGAAHPASWVEVRYENEPTVRIVALFSGEEVAKHDEALRRIVSYPDQLVVRASPWPAARLAEIRHEIHEMATSSETGLFSGWGTGNGKVGVTLRADGEPVARQLQKRYLSAVDITVGFLHFPDCGFSQPQALNLADDTRPQPRQLPAGLSLAATEDLEVRTGGNLRSAVRLINDRPIEAVVNTNGQLTASVVNPDTNTTVGGYSGAQTMPLVLFRAPSGGSVEIPLLVGTASTLPQLGYAVPPGSWAIEVILELGDQGLFRAPLIPLSVVP